jgi:lipopolysaccharide transport system ATP-binding protein
MWCSAHWRTVSGSGEAKVIDIAMLSEKGQRLDVVSVGSQVTLWVKVALYAPVSRLVIGYVVKDRLGQAIYGTNTDYTDNPIYDLKCGEEVTFSFFFAANLGPGTYSVAIALHSNDTHVINNYEWRDLALVFNVINMSHATFVGNTWLPPEILIERVP